jgi:WXG100 family type VII secretion target
MSEQIRMNFQAMEDMAKAFKDGAQDLEEIEAKIKEIAGTIDNGALQGKAGAALGDALRDKLSPELGKLKEKIEELEKDVREALHQMQNADEIASGYYKD